MARLTRAVTALLFAFAALAGLTPSSSAAELAAEGRRATLHVTIRTNGEVDYRTGVRDGGVKWKSTRTYEATVEVAAGSPTSALGPDVAGAFDGAAANHVVASAPTPPSTDVKALQAQLAACPKQDVACQMRIGMQIASSPYVQEQQRASMAQAQLPARYQSWRAVRHGHANATAAIEDAWQSVFYSAGREWDDCTLKGPSMPPNVAAAGASTASPDALATRLESIARGLTLVVDGSSGASSIQLLPATQLPAEEHCKGAIANSGHETREQRWVGVVPKAVLPEDFWIEGNRSSTAGSLIASGHATLKGEGKLTDGGPHFAYAIDAMVPYEVELSWELTPL